MSTEVLNPRSAAPQATPISIKISGQDLVGAPQKVEISQLGFVGEQDVIVRSEGHSDPVAVTMRHEIDPRAPKDVDLQLRKPKLTVSANPPAIAGFVGFRIPQMLDLPPSRAGLVVPAATSFSAAILINVI